MRSDDEPIYGEVSAAISRIEAAEASSSVAFGTVEARCAAIDHEVALARARRSDSKPTVTLAEARARMGRTFGVDPAFWTWSVDEIRFLAAENRRGMEEANEGPAYITPAVDFAQRRTAVTVVVTVAIVILLVLVGSALA